MAGESRPPPAGSASDPALVVIRPPQRGLPKPSRPVLRDLPSEELQRFAQATLGGPRYRATQLFEWLHKHRAERFGAMSSLPAALRERLEAEADVGVLTVELVQRAADGTRKLRLATPDGAVLESVLIPNEGRGLTQCISSMVGCSLSCRFCATASLGFARNLATWEIVDQVYRAQALLADERDEAGYPPRITNVVFMGMGEPLHNFVQVRRAIAILTDPAGAAIAGRRITVSTAGMVPAIERFAREGLAEEVGLAVSLNATTDAVRDQVMPINTRWNIETLLATVRALPTPKRRRVTFEYVLLAGVNDSDADARRLVSLIEGLPAIVNVIPFNPHDDAPYRRPSKARVDAFVRVARASGLQVQVRTPRGDDIDAACGQLARR
ncbi:MAG: 23S rRNA (adenine(2503)-C(2))-methyltransferase RlmN [Myxococcota bacterium]